MTNGWKHGLQSWALFLVLSGIRPLAAQQAPLAPEPATDMTVRAGEDVRLEFKPMSEVQLEVIPLDRVLPTDASVQLFEGTQAAGRKTNNILQKSWVPSNFFHQPLYFDDTPLERYGQSVCPTLQPIISGTHFFLTFPIMPYKLGVDRPYDCVTTLGLYRPGECVPCVREALPYRGEADAVFLQTATTLGWIFLLP
jgi:hypothetical protein